MSRIEIFRLLTTTTTITVKIPCSNKHEKYLFCFVLFIFSPTTKGIIIGVRARILLGGKFKKKKTLYKILKFGGLQKLGGLLRIVTFLQ